MKLQVCDLWEGSKVQLSGFWGNPGSGFLLELSNMEISPHTHIEGFFMYEGYLWYQLLSPLGFHALQW